MRNFMCYREQALDFTGIHLACLTGDNGHGKSAILDALTWSLWGRSRVGARRDDELIHLGEKEMEVEFEFLLSDDGAARSSDLCYRVLRKRSARRRGQSGLELHGWDPEEERFRSLTETSITRTQRKINELLRMDYDTFINSAFLLQGRADEFTVKRPAERKRVLSDILGLEIYDRYEALAKEAAQDRRAEADRCRATIEQIEIELSREGEYRAAVEAAESELSRVAEERTAAQATHDQARSELRDAQEAERQLAEVEKRLDADLREVQRLSDEITRHQHRLGELERALTQEAEIEAAYAAYQQAQAENEALNNKLAALVSLNQRYSEIETVIAAARHELDVEQRGAAERVRGLQETTVRAADQEQERREVQANLARLEEREAERERALIEVQELTATGATLQADNKRAEADAAQIKEKIDLLGAAGEEALCPLCGQALADDDCARLLGQFQDDLETERTAYARRMEQMRENHERVKALRVLQTEIGRELRARTGWQRKEAALAHVLREAEEAQQDMPAAQEAVDEIQRRLDANEYAPEAHRDRAEVEQQLAELGYDADAHREVQARLEAGKESESRLRTLREARLGLETVRLAMSQLEQSRAQAETRTQADKVQVEALRQVSGRLPALRQQTMEALRTLEGAHDREQQANMRLGAAHNKLDYCEDLRGQRVKREEEERALREEQGVYQELQRAFGKNGVQAMLIEQAIPEIEEEANRLLARMTRGAMQVRFETQRGTRSGSTVETLDIHISDALGTRAYETYSGGERYRINFGIRIALSKLLARRAGAQLRMLVIDEGFGTQDAEGRDGLIDALNAVRDDFSCILAITHIEELKNAFNVRIEVEKTAEGSQDMCQPTLTHHYERDAIGQAPLFIHTRTVQGNRSLQQRRVDGDDLEIPRATHLA
jgi:exonuclease SbcC